VTPTTPSNVLVVGGGGREHALTWKLTQSAKVKHVFCVPGNGGTAKANNVSNVEIKVSDFEKIAEFAKQNKVELIVIGPDNPLADGIVDELQKHGLRVFGPTKSSARLEWSKAYAKEFMAGNNIPTARFLATTNREEALEFARANEWARVVKVDGLALGKGVFVCDCFDDVAAALEEIFEKKLFGQAGECVLIEERLNGEELSLLYFCDGKRLSPMPASQDHKRRFDGDRGPNTGGMGVYAPVKLYQKCADKVQALLVKPFEAALASNKFSYQGIVYAGMMIAANDEPYVLEFNARFGDPETQALLPLLETDLFEILWACTEGTLEKTQIKWSNKFSCCVVAAAQSYPASSSKGQVIEIGDMPESCQVFQAGTKWQGDQLTTDGGRVLAVTAVATSMDAARDKAYDAIKMVKFKGMDYRKDIARRAAEECLSS
jgi:phosphoribosylamine--glycine ligase